LEKWIAGCKNREKSLLQELLEERDELQGEVEGEGKGEQLEEVTFRIGI
jgi:hypothetical protein